MRTNRSAHRGLRPGVDVADVSGHPRGARDIV